MLILCSYFVGYPKIQKQNMSLRMDHQMCFWIVSGRTYRKIAKKQGIPNGLQQNDLAALTPKHFFFGGYVVKHHEDFARLRVNNVCDAKIAGAGLNRG
jgi:hypothetical protein